MKRLAKQMGLDGKSILVIGDGRSEISAGAELGAAMISRLSEDAVYQRELHKKLGTNVIVADYTSEDLYKMFK